MDPSDSPYFADFKSLSVKELKAICTLKGVSTDGCVEKADLVAALEAAASSMDISDSAAATDISDGATPMETSNGATPMETSSAAAVEAESDDDEDDQEALLAQALLMSQESESGLSALPIKELRQRALARCVDIRGITEKEELVAALLGSEADDSSPPPPPPALAGGSSEGDAPPPGVEVLARFPMPFACFTAADIGFGVGLEHAGKVMLPNSCLMALSFLGDLPSTMLLRMTYHERSVYVGVADFVEDAKAFDKTSEYGQSVPVWGPRGHAVAAVFVPRWVRSQLGCVNGDEALLSLVSLPKASFMQLSEYFRIRACVPLLQPPDERVFETRPWQRRTPTPLPPHSQSAPTLARSSRSS